VGAVEAVEVVPPQALEDGLDLEGNHLHPALPVALEVAGSVGDPRRRPIPILNRLILSNSTATRVLVALIQSRITARVLAVKVMSELAKTLVEAVGQIPTLGTEVMELIQTMLVVVDGPTLEPKTETMEATIMVEIMAETTLEAEDGSIEINTTKIEETSTPEQTTTALDTAMAAKTMDIMGATFSAIITELLVAFLEVAEGPLL